MVILQVIEAFKILTSDSRVKAILVNIFGKTCTHLPHHFNSLFSETVLCRIEELIFVNKNRLSLFF